MAEDAALADAAASALGNRAKSVAHIEGALEAAMGIAGVLGCLLIVGGHLGARGELRIEGA